MQLSHGPFQEGVGNLWCVNLAIFATSCTSAALPCTGPSNVRFVAVLLFISNTSQSNLHITQRPTRRYLRFDIPDVGICLQHNVRISEIYPPRHRVNSSLHKHSAAEHGDVPAVVSYYLTGWWSAFAAPLFGGAPTTMQAVVGVLFIPTPIKGSVINWMKLQ